MIPIIEKILTKWIEITEYDDTETRFNLLSSKYAFHRCGDRIKDILKFDSSGGMACLYAKASFETICKDLQVSICDLMKEPDLCKDYIDMWSEFCCPEMQEAEKNIIHKIIEATQLNTAIGDINTEKEMNIFMDSIEYVAEELTKCHIDSYYTNLNSTISSNLFFNKAIYVFNTTTECLLTVEKSTDGIYLCYITEFGSNGGYFAYMIKSGENILSVNDKIYEHYTGQHLNSRNNRHIEDKKWHIFPYSDMVEAKDYDYKGYAKTLVCTDEVREISSLSARSIYCIMLSAALIINKFSGRKVSELVEEDEIRQLYVNSMLKYNEHQEQVNALVPINSNSLILKAAREFPIDFNSEDVASNALQERFNSKNYEKHYKDYHPEFGCYTDYNSDFVEWYGKGFKIDCSKIMVRKWPRLTGGSENDTIEEEFIGTEYAMQTEFYRQARGQLKEYILNKMSEEYNNFGGYDAIVKWYYDRIEKIRPKIEKMCIEYYIKSQTDPNVLTEYSYCLTPTCEEQVCQIKYGDAGFWTPHIGTHRVLNQAKTTRNDWSKTPTSFYDIYSDTTANVWFAIIPGSWQNIEALLEEEVPQILKGYTYYQSSRTYTGNSILDSTDPIADICHPLSGEFHGYQMRSYCEKFPKCESQAFGFIIGFSKRTLNKLVKEYKEE